MQPPTDPINRRFRLFDGNGVYVSPDGRPADISRTSGIRVLVIYPPHGSYGWSLGRTYPHMPPLLTLDAVMGDAEAADWLGRITLARENDIMARNGR